MIDKISVSTSKRCELIDITEKINNVILKYNLTDGICMLYVAHTTAGIIINENYDPTVKNDILNKLSEVIPFNSNYTHSEGNSDSHIKATLVGNSKNLFIKNKKLFLGKWEGVFLAEFDGPRNREVNIKLLSDN